ncbi:ABC transporter substrate-binding protein [Paenibacillus abyssi]|uniref:Sugar ABC transporter substrate-binding protein n=1 Tax=Paenibacillus abyssi TaxID=1340531 RepID=A0A917D1U4_9BACL|nr:extracellular solute-binding protein [Paenibacillus abyssi]GGG07992.1 sugar ABC transporter substrate-binding protein [Paenibacillus abyssi]
MKTKLRNTRAFAMILAAALFLAACGGNAADQTESTNAENGKISLKVYAQHFDDDTAGPFDYAVEQLKTAMPNVEIELDEAVQDGYQKLKTYAATGNLPDIYFTDWATLQTFAKSQNVVVLDDYEATEAFKSNMNPGLETRLVAPDGHVYAFPDTGIEFQLIYYNKEIFEKVGIETPIKTVNQMVDAAKKLKEAGYVPMSIFAKEKWITTALYNGFVVREQPQGLGALGEDGLTALPEPYVTAAEQVKALQQAGLFDANATNTNYDQASSMFYQEKAAMFVNGQWEIYSSQEKLGDKVDWMYWPAKDEATYEASKFYINGAGSPQGYAVSPSSKNVDTAVEVAAFLAEKAAEYRYTQLGSPIVASKTDKPIASDVPAMMQRLATEVLPNADAYSVALNKTEIQNAVNDSTQSMLIDGFTVDNFVENLNRALKKANE